MFATGAGELARARQRWDVCVVGSGPAGVTLARVLGERGLSVALLEAGPAHYSESSQACYQAEVVGRLKFRPDVSRLRMFGGTSNHWGGWSRPLDADDFGPKVPGIDTEWPIGRSALDPYLGEAASILELPPPEPDRPVGEDLATAPIRYSPPVNFGRKYRSWLEGSPQVFVALEACVTGLREPRPDEVEVEVTDAARGRHLLRARRLVLCAGGIENSRLLLWANARHGGRVVPDPRALGRYWMEHPHFTLGDVVLDASAPFTFDAKGLSYVAPVSAARERLGILACSVRFQRKSYDDTKRLIAGLACVAPSVGEALFRRLRQRLVCGALVRAAWEQSPRPWNRVVLSDRRDEFGMPRAEVHWRLTDLEVRTARRSVELLAQWLARTGHGRVRIDPWVLGEAEIPTDDETVGNHHMGGTRMSADPARGVVDRDCRVHGTSALYVCGSSVFPSGGHANPTLTIVQLALRLADHLSARPAASGELGVRPGDTASPAGTA